MIEILFTPSFDRIMRKLEPALLAAVSETLELFKNRTNHKQLKVHKLHGRMTGLCSFSIDYKHRVIFQWVNKKQALLLDFGDHSMYE
jgi:mRNA-degrading endonuclease YafQ of YafQ-DinJ toxin-antitoxin module